MGFIVRGTKYIPAPEGLHNAVCVDVIELGVVATKFGDKEMIKLIWELEPESAGLMDNGRRYTISRRYTPSLHEKAQLHKDLKAWRGRVFTPEELRGFDLDNVINAPCKILVTHTESDGTVFGNIGAIMKADKDHKLLASGEYVRMKDRPEQERQNGQSGGFRAPAGEDEIADYPEPPPF